MTKTKDQRDQALLKAIFGESDIGAMDGHIEDDYLRREKVENALEQGESVPDEAIPEFRSEEEKIIWKSNKDMERVEGCRVNRTPEGFPDREFQGVYIKSRTVDIV